MIPFSEKYYRLSLLIFGWLGCFFIPNTILAQVPDQPSNYITDVANLLSEEEETLLNSTLKSFEDSTTNQIFVLLTQSLQGRNIEELTIETATRWGVGQKGKDNSLLIAFYVLDHHIRFEVGYGLEANLTDYE
ncbi:MAG: TPM domain-containing protein, partial [Bacteroidetes bacterium]|nr:TPM domain-containing protein [Bacteroidota bacterium]